MPGPADGTLGQTDPTTALARSERGLRQLIDSVRDPMLLIAHDGVIVVANPAAEELLGWAASDLAGMPVEDVIAPASRAEHRARREKFAADLPTGPVGVVGGVFALSRSGREIPVSIALAGIETADGPLMGVTIMDASARLSRERQDAALRRIAAAAGTELPVDRLLTMVVEEAASLLTADKSLMARFDPDGEVVIVGSHGDHLTSVGDHIPRGSGSSLVAVARTGAPARLFYDDLPEDDPIRELALTQDHHQALAVPISVHTRLWGGLMVAARDDVPPEAADALTRFAEYAGAVIGASESRAVERALRESEERFRLLADFIPQLVWTADADGAYDFLNRRWAEYTGVATEEQLGLRWLDRVHPDDHPALMRAWDAAVNGRAPFAAEFRIRRHDGLYRRFDARAVAMRDDTGAAVKWFGSNTDVEEARAAAAAVRASEAQLRAALDAGGMGAWTYDAARREVRVDRNVRTLFEIPDDITDAEVQGPLDERIHRDDRLLIREVMTRALEGVDADYRAEYRIVRDDGSLRWIDSRGQVARDADGAARMVTGVLLDVTAAREAGERLLRSQKLEALGTLAGGIAHDFNNLLQVVGGNVGLARDTLAAGHPALEPLGTVERAAQRGADLVDRILAFSRPEDGSPRDHLDIAALVDDTLDLLRPTLPAMIELRCSSAERLPPVVGDPAAVAQIVTNLAANAAQAIGRSPGVVRFEIDAVDLRAEDLPAVPDAREGRYVRVVVTDDGPGMDASVLPRIFDPFFTTKGPGAGTGLGLSIVQSLMRAHAGVVTVHSRPGTGTVFQLYFPVGSGAVIAGPEGAARPVATARAGRVLFVDDEPDLVALHERSLGRAGHVVSGYTDPRSALARFREGPDDFDVVVTDLSMPGMSGLELARGILALRPGIPVLIATGYIPPEERAEAEALGVRAILPKPSPIARVREVLAGVLADGGGRDTVPPPSARS
ncbi:MAG: PAS domain S-box protein [Thermoleophilia bacterium]|nr:PAS domain S-box protein [Thermoleophilia bacterium]